MQLYLKLPTMIILYVLLWIAFAVLLYYIVVWILGLLGIPVPFNILKVIMVIICLLGLIYLVNYLGLPAFACTPPHRYR